MQIFVYDDAARLIGEYDDLGRARIEHVWLDDRPIAAITYTYTGTSTTPATTTTSYVETDHLATPRLITNASRQKRWTWESAPYGDTLPNENPQALGTYKYNLRFPGQYFDSETNHHYNHHRDYESTSGRYVQSDPIGLDGGIQTYAYAAFRPLMYIDPVGLMEIYRSGGVTFHSYPGPQAGGIEHARHGPGESYHIHVKDAAGNVAKISTETWKPLLPEDERVYSRNKGMQAACEKLTEGEKKFFDRVNRQIFHRGGPTVNQIMRIGEIVGAGRKGGARASE
jgi:RHS repeat-associated protein